MASTGSDVQRIFAAVARRVRAVLGIAPRSAPARRQGVPQYVLADWRRYAAELERALERRSAAPPLGAVIRHEIALPPGDAPGEDGRPNAGFTLASGAAAGPRVTVIIPVYDDTAMTLECLRSLAADNPSTVQVEYVVVDDASPAADVARQLSSVPGITFLRNAENLGFLRTCNRAALLSTADYVMFLNNDTLVRPGWLDELVRTAEQDPHVGVVGAKLIYPDGSLQEAGGLIWRDASGWNYGRGGRPDDPSYEYVRDVDYCSGAALLVRRALFEQVGRFDERFAPAYYEDCDLCFAVRRAGFRVVYQPRAVVVHREGATGGTDTGAGVKRHQMLNLPKFRRKWSDVLESEHLVHEPAAVARAVRRLQGRRIVVMIDNYVPEPDRDAGSNRNVHIIRLLRELGSHVMFMPDNYLASQPYTDDLQQLGVEVLYHIDGGPTADHRLRDALAIADLVWVARPDVFLKYRAYFDRLPDLPVVYDTVDLHYVRMARELELRGEAATAADHRMQADAKRLELEIAGRVDVTVAVTDTEKQTLEAEGIQNVRICHTVHVERPRTHRFEQTDGLIFIGGYNHTPNVDAAEWLVNEIMPSVWDELPELNVTLLGSNPSDRVWSLARDRRVHVTGYIHDVGPYFQSARVFVAPLRFGAGLKGKIGHSMEYGLPVVTTSVGAEGFDFVDGRDALVADGAEAFAAAIKRLYSDPVAWNRLSAASRSKLAPLLPERAKERLESIIAEAVRRRRARRSELVRA
ncbi:MAG TPA: glycosyltransferase [Candidatus Elarobacter sp.]|nr:glycosyltransferase [Candidatus Elarobacter sp.]